MRILKKPENNPDTIMKVHAKMLHKEIKNIIEYDDNESKKILNQLQQSLLSSVHCYFYFSYIKWKSLS